MKSKKRGYIARKRLELIKKKYKDLQNESYCATLIQKYVRKYLSIKKYKEMKLIKNAVILIQRMYRG